MGQLVLSRKVGEKIVINADITITVTEIDRNKCRIGIEAPTDYRILRKELLDAEAARKGRPAGPAADSGTDHREAGGAGGGAPQAG